MTAKLYQARLNGALLQTGTVGSTQITDGTIATADVATNAVTVQQLDYAATTDLHNGTAMTNNAWNDVGTNQSFTVADANSTVVIEITTMLQVLTGGNNCEGRITVDSAGTPQTRDFPLSGIAGLMSGRGQLILTGLSAGTHTVKLQVWETGAGATLYLRAATINFEGLWISVMEHKR